MSAARRPGTAVRGAAAAVGLALVALLSAACSAPAPIALGDIELPPDLEPYEGAEEPTIDFVLSQVIETLPDGADLDYAVYNPTDAADLDQWLPGSLSRAGFEESDDDLVLVSGRWERGGQTFTWATIPFNQADGTVVELIMVMLTTAG